MNVLDIWEISFNKLQCLFPWNSYWRMKNTELSSSNNITFHTYSHDSLAKILDHPILFMTWWLPTLSNTLSPLITHSAFINTFLTTPLTYKSFTEPSSKPSLEVFQVVRSPEKRILDNELLFHFHWTSREINKRNKRIRKSMLFVFRPVLSL